MASPTGVAPRPSRSWMSCAERKSSKEAIASTTAVRCRVGRRGARSVLVIVLSVGRVPVAVVDVVDVVAVLHGRVAAVRRRGRARAPRGSSRARAVRSAASRGGTAGKGARRRRRCRSHTPSGQVEANIASASSTIVGPGATVACDGQAGREEQAADGRDDADPHRAGERGPERPGQLLRRRDRHHHQRRDEQQPDRAHRHGDA